MKGLNLRYEAISKIDPENNTLETKGGNKVTYDYLITAPGLVLRYDKIEGAMDALQDPNSPVGSIYMMDYAYKTSRIREEFKGGNAIFMIPQMPVKCGGGPQKIMYLSEETFRRNGVRNKANIHWYSTVGVMFPNCLKFSDKLNQIRKEKDITTHFFHDMYKIDKNNRVAYFKDTKNDNAIVKVDYDMLHIVPPQNAPEFLKPIAAANGYVDVNPATLQHVKYPNIFAIGDSANLPTAKTAAGVMSQAPILVHNLV
jgi:NADPH-dependent 2,4-dienoyl-CoA reductase/sulfur reductase-like enzyme